MCVYVCYEMSKKFSELKKNKQIAERWNDDANKNNHNFDD